MNNNRILNSIAILSLALFFVSCGKNYPKCDDEDVIDELQNKFLITLDNDGYNRKNIDFGYGNYRTDKVDKDAQRCECAADVLFVKGSAAVFRDDSFIKIVKYTAQYTSKGSIYVEVNSIE